MPTARRPLRHTSRQHINAAVINAWKRCDYHAMHEALGLAPFHRSPLPADACWLGVSQGETYNDPDMLDRWGPQAQELQKQLMELYGPPDADALRQRYQ